MPTTIFRCLLLSLAAVYSSSYAASGHEQGQLSMVQQQLDIIQRLAAQAESSGSAQPNERYRFDYPRLAEDIQRIRQGVQSYLSPTRAQPSDAGELVGDYRLDTPAAEPSP
ncbi:MULTISPECIES: integrative conjugative element protein, RAQPRD family [Pseudomonas]|uniref:Conjugal transfer protein n=1 Tax=Pseudomonas lini TaxID=163011 RepID=A0A0J6HL39_9PSED|nr:RAQPRD family integrative conjugative element protein [Pseudomonas lini]KAB0502643.1 conjugal transfer protein [Pseudomonas lini]KMM95069.1 conjugal transfer protein [Pseudomonas lini]SDT26271.1 integrative conjugative element protein, RAQPRD family [Pseudomonas lini]